MSDNMCTDKETLEQLTVVESFLHESYPHLNFERGHGRHEIIINEPRISMGPGAYHEFKGLKKSLEHHFSCIKVEEKADKLIVSI